MQRPRASLRLVALESREVPALFGNAWANPLGVTLSFVPDGTSVDGRASALFQTLQSAGSSAAWQRDVLRAVQAWTQSGLANVGVVADGGQALGASGAAQSDSRFGDIRIAAAPLGPDVLAITTPPSPGGGTRAGDIVLNSNKVFSLNGATGTHDLYSVMLQEVGHALGLGNSDDPASPRYEEYSGVRTGLTADDKADFRTLYGSRAADAYEGGSTNNTLSNARAVAIPLLNVGLLQTAATAVVVADLASASDVDYFKFVAPVGLDRTATIRLRTAGMSLAGARLTILASNRTTVIGSAVAPAGGGEAAVAITVTPALTYYVKVEAADATFAAGSYQLRFVFDENAPDVPEAQSDQKPVNDLHTDDTINRAGTLNSVLGYAANSHYRALATLRDTLDADVYRVRTPDAGNGERVSVAVNLIAATGGLQPTAELYDRDGRRVAAAVLANGRGGYTLFAGDVEENRDYYVRVTAAASGAARTGNYYLDINFRSQPVELAALASGTLTAAAPVSYRTLEVSQSQLLQFELSAAAAGAPTGAKLRMTIYDASGMGVFTQLVDVGQTASVSTYLEAGKYTIKFTSSAAGVAFDLKGAAVSDPIGARRIDPNQQTASTAPPPKVSKESDDSYARRERTDPSGSTEW